MPFDSKEFGPLVFTPGKEGLSKLAHVLRHKELWPENHCWEWSGLFTCAMGIAHRTWPRHIACPNTHRMAAAFNLPGADMRALFLTDMAPQPNHETTPEMIADALDRYVTSGELP